MATGPTQALNPDTLIQTQPAHPHGAETPIAKVFARILLVIPALLAGCQSLPAREPVDYVALYHEPARGDGRFEVCHSYGCEDSMPVRLDDAQWATLARCFQPPAPDPATERRQVACAVARMEALVGPVTGIDQDMPANTIDWKGRGGQVDCVAETVNTTQFLLLFQERGWLRHHRVAWPAHRGFLQLLGPHNSALLEEAESGRRYVVDSWFHANGEPPEVVPLEDWMAGYDPRRRRGGRDSPPRPALTSP